MKYRVFFHQGEELGLKTRVSRGEAWLDGEGLHVRGASQFLIKRTDIVGVELFRLHGLGRVVRVDHSRGRLFLSVVRLMIGQFAFINFFKTGSLHKELTVLTEQNRANP